MKSFLLVTFFTLASIIGIAQFQNPLANQSGYVVAASETEHQDLIVIAYFDKGFHFSRISKIGELLRQVPFNPVSPSMQIDWVNEKNDTIIVSGSYTEPNYKTFLQVMMVYDHDFNLLYSTYHVFADVRTLSHDIFYQSTPDLLWSGFVHHRLNKASLDAVIFNSQGHVVMHKSVDSLTAHSAYAKMFKTKNGYKIFASLYDHWKVYTLNNELAVLDKDSLDLVGLGDSLGIGSCSDILSVIQLNDSTYFANAVCRRIFSNKSVGSLFKFVNDTFVSVEIARLQQDSMSDFAVYHRNLNLITMNQKAIYTLGQYQQTEFGNQTLLMHQFDVEGNFQKTHSVIKMPNEYISAHSILALQDGGCLFVGSSDLWDWEDTVLLAENMIYLVKLDTNGLITFTVPLSKSPIPSYQLYPNPGTNTIEGLLDANAVLLTEMNGQTYQLEVTDGKVNVSLLPSGLYIVTAYNQFGELVHKGKWVKQD